MTAADTTARAPKPVRPFYWSVRRELWEHGALWIAPLAVAGVILLGFLISLSGSHGAFSSVHSSRTSTVTQTTSSSRTVVTENGVTRTYSVPGKTITTVVTAPPPSAEQQRALAALPFEIMAVVMLIAMFLVALFYSLGALHNERRDRSILFWRSLPVNDLTAVAAKATVPLAVLPVIVLAVTVGLQALIMGLGLAYDAATGRSLASLLSVSLGELMVVMAYGVVVLSLWWAPVYAWLLLVSVWARRAPFLWAVLPPLAVAVTERLAFGANHFGDILVSRLSGCFEEAFVAPTQGSRQIPVIGVAQIDAGRFLATPGVWVGLAVAAAFLAATVWLRRRRDPI